MKIVFIVILTPCLVLANFLLIENDTEKSRVNLIVDLIALNIKNNGWNNIITYGHLPDSYFNKIKEMPFTFITSNSDEDDYYVEDAVLYHSNTILIECTNLTNFEESFRQVMNLPQWQPLANVIILYQNKEAEQKTARIFYILWYYQVSNAILVQFDDSNTALISQYNPFVVDESFRIFLAIILWSFFVINFSTQAAIISFFTASKRGKEVETFADVIEKGYKIQGLASPDVVLPDDDENFQKINSKLEPISDIFGCVNAMTSNDTHRFCLIDCSVGRYLERNKLNSRGEQYLHIAKDRIHNHYLNFIFQKHSVMTESVNRYLMKFFEAGLIMKWEQYRFNDIKEESPVKPLGMEEFKGVFQAYFCAILITVVIFIIELMIGSYSKMKLYCTWKVNNWKRTRKARRIVKLERKHNKITMVSSSTQTS